MYELNNTIIAVSSPTSDSRVIVRLTGPDVVDKVRQVFTSAGSDKAGVWPGRVAIDAELKIDAWLYLFIAPHSYTGETLAEIHVPANPSVTEAVIERLLTGGVRLAGPGEFTARAYLNGKIDLAQAEAVNEIIVASNKSQLDAAENILSGRLGQTTERIRSSILNLLSLIEAGLDFSGEDIDFVSTDQAVEKLAEIRADLEQLLAGRCADESLIDLPAVGIAGAPNAGKSSLGNRLLGRERSIVSHKRKTTRDILTGQLTLTNTRCVLFDCAGLISQPNNVLDELAQTAAIEALQNCELVVFCVDIARADWVEDISVRKLIEPRVIVSVATKSDLLSENVLTRRLDELGKLFGADFLATSTKTGKGLTQLRERIDERIIELNRPTARNMLSPAEPVEDRTYETRETTPAVTLTARHRQAVTETIENTSDAAEQIKAGNNEVAAMMLRAAHLGISNIDRHPIDEQILENIFSNFCIGK